MKRPEWNNDMLQELATYTADIIAKWTNENYDNEDMADLIEECAGILEYEKYSDGYALAKDFEDKGYDSDSRLVEELDNIAYKTTEIIKSHVEKWVLENKLTLDIHAGDAVKFNDRQGVKNGVVKSLRPETLDYVIWHEGLNENTGLIIAAEKTEKL